MLTRAYHPRVNNSGDPIASWKSDLSFKTSPSLKPKPPKPSASDVAPSSTGWCALSAPEAAGRAWSLVLLVLLLGAARPLSARAEL